MELNLEVKGKTFNDWVKIIKGLPYGRISDKKRPELVFLEKRGSCSNKHIVLKLIGDKLEVEELQLYLGIFKMSPETSPHLSSILNQNDLEYIPEAHCYLKRKGKVIDATSTTLNWQLIQENILEEIEMTAEQVIAEKENYHKNYLKKWLFNENSSLSLSKIWDIREECIAELSKHN